MALRLAFTGYVDIPRESDFDFLSEAEAAFIQPPPAKKKPNANKAIIIKASAKDSPKSVSKKAETAKKKVAA